MITMTVTGGGSLLALIGLQAKYWLGLGHAAHIAGQILVRDVQSGMQSAGGGRIYAGQRRQSGAPGGYPAVQSGQLIGSIDYEVQGVRALWFGSRGAFNRGYNYAVGVHEGTSKMAARPYLKLTVDRKKAEIARVLGDSVYQKLIGA